MKQCYGTVDGVADIYRKKAFNSNCTMTRALARLMTV